MNILTSGKKYVGHDDGVVEDGEDGEDGKDGGDDNKKDHLESLQKEP